MRLPNRFPRRSIRPIFGQLSLIDKGRFFINYEFGAADGYNVRFRKKQIDNALLAARRVIKREARPAAGVAAALNSVMACTEIEGVTGRPHEELRSIIFAVMGDAYRAEGNVELAAKWYRRASQLFPGDHARVYAHVVCQHQLTDFYQDALKVLEDYHREWLTKPFSTRFGLRLKRLLNREERAITRAAQQDLDFLRQHSVAQAA